MKVKSDFSKNKEKTTLESVITRKKNKHTNNDKNEKVNRGHIKLYKRNSVNNFIPYI